MAMFAMASGLVAVVLRISRAALAAPSGSPTDITRQYMEASAAASGCIAIICRQYMATRVALVLEVGWLEGDTCLASGIPSTATPAMIVHNATLQHGTLFKVAATSGGYKEN